jgi:hypothetical protein
MLFQNRLLIVAASVFALATTSVAIIGPADTTWAAENERVNTAQAGASPAALHLQLTPSSAQLAACMPNADVDVNVKLTTDKKGFDIFDIRARHIAPNRDYTVFLLQQAGAPFAAADYIGDLSTNDEGNGDAQFDLIVQEVLSSTIVNGQRYEST